VNLELRCPQDGASSTDRDRWLRALLDPGWLVGMNLFKRIAHRARAILTNVERGMTTAEYAVGTVAAVAFAVVLYKIVRSPAVSSALSSIITSALHAI
jgi:L-alanine-DL-glutamate epimerase-like enolase superfamily enzyme